jgi:glycosyltransferase involved in cell wall biosynthesis
LILRSHDSPSRASAGPGALRLRAALVHEWLITLGGSDRVLLALHHLYPDAPIFTSLYAPGRLPPAYARLPVVPSWLQRLPGAARYHRSLVPLMPAAFERFRLRGYDVVISSSHACAKGVRVSAGTPHICYCHTPMRYAWDLQDEYLRGFAPPLRPVVRAMLARLRRWDKDTSARVDYFIANSRFVAQRIDAHYGRTAAVIYPPVDTDYFTPGDGGPGRYYLVVSRLVPYKRVDLAVQACTRLSVPLIVVGDGPESASLRKMAGPTVRFVGEVDDAALREYYRGCTALIFPGIEDFGLVPVEAQACGRPVIAHAGGGALESVLPEVTGRFFSEQTVESLMAALREFAPDMFLPDPIRRHAERFSVWRFQTEVDEFVRRVVSTVASGR